MDIYIYMYIYIYIFIYIFAYMKKNFVQCIGITFDIYLKNEIKLRSALT